MRSGASPPARTEFSSNNPWLGSGQPDRPANAQKAPLIMNAALDRMMDFDLTDEQRLIRRTVRDFAEAEILPHVERYEREERYPTELIERN